MRADPFSECHCPLVYSVEPHGNGYAIYYARCIHKHGSKLGYLTETDEYTAQSIEKALNESLEKKDG